MACKTCGKRSKHSHKKAHKAANAFGRSDGFTPTNPIARSSINSGMKNGSVRYEPSTQGGEFIAAGAKGFGGKKSAKRRTKKKAHHE